jgi:uncharacterized protein
MACSWKFKKKISRRFRKKWLGINCLDLSASEVFYFCSLQDVSGVWVDDPRLRESLKKQDQADYVLKRMWEKQWDGLYFGSVAFKYQPAVQDLEKMTKLACSYVDVITTSGSATGSPPSIEKIMTMKKAAGSKPLAIASGITPENVEQYIPFTDFFLVATGISKSFFEIDPALLNSLLDKVRK